MTSLIKPPTPLPKNMFITGWEHQKWYEKNRNEVWKGKSIMFKHRRDEIPPGADPWKW